MDMDAALIVGASLDDRFSWVASLAARSSGSRLLSRSIARPVPLRSHCDAVPGAADAARSGFVPVHERGRSWEQLAAWRF